MTEQTKLSSGRLHYRTIWLGFAVVLAGMLSLESHSVAAQGSVEPTRNQGRRLSLEVQLRLGLRATTKGDKAFIKKVADLVQQGKLPKKLVDGTFLWARQRAARKSRSRELRPMVYFKPALVLRSKRIGVKL